MKATQYQQYILHGVVTIGGTACRLIWRASGFKIREKGFMPSSIQIDLLKGGGTSGEISGDQFETVSEKNSLIASLTNEQKYTPFQVGIEIEETQITDWANVYYQDQSIVVGPTVHRFNNEDGFQQIAFVS